MPTYHFTITIAGTGDNPDEAWVDAICALALDPGGWDTSFVGFIAAFDSDIRKEYNCRHITQRIIDRVRSRLHQEVETYSKYLSGDVVGFTVEGEDDYTDSCWGFYSTEDALDEAKVGIDYHIKSKIKEHIKRLKQQIRSKVPFQYRSSLLLKSEGL